MTARIIAWYQRCRVSTTHSWCRLHTCRSNLQGKAEEAHIVLAVESLPVVGQREHDLHAILGGLVQHKVQPPEGCLIVQSCIIVMSSGEGDRRQSGMSGSMGVVLSTVSHGVLEHQLPWIRKADLHSITHHPRLLQVTNFTGWCTHPSPRQLLSAIFAAREGGKAGAYLRVAAG